MNMWININKELPAINKEVLGYCEFEVLKYHLVKYTESGFIDRHGAYKIVTNWMTLPLEPSKTTDKFTVEKVKNATAKVFDIPVEALSGKTRARQVVDARKCAIHIIMSNLVITTSRAGEKFNRDHSTVIYSFKKAKDLLTTDKVFKSRYEEIMYLLPNSEKEKVSILGLPN